MAVKVDQLLKKDANHNQDLSITKNHIRCFCHKLALILNAGLKAISVPRRDQIPTGPVLRFVPGALINASQPPWRTPNRMPGADWRARLHAKENRCVGPHANLQNVDRRAGVHANLQNVDRRAGLHAENFAAVP
ncbi:uncharacterized protein PGTG_04978 [Puccinia graminis f. sp. tritici CRL 75-36-700-3]|uniref:Uncharacterized protein n=1 Tax=Puccinia graminis f. sp. tritici (strain CRL 75-36-700-3 / race SCCL) TaxID=418459 RepID=E3K3G5_PUCGT|nr:uncharacterized protein PGTG_04978 [Puccinia graminis f. sp. tritici CRL 75-36-700-3]EFP79022.2 hypothetical protein PGTG_04978 [Puccinia graminis f. sp. tritici CRL 75-36-700-3]